MNITPTIRSLIIVTMLAVALSFGTGCKTAGEKKYEEAKALQKRGLNDQAIAAFEESAKLLGNENNEPGRAWEKLSSMHKGAQNYAEAEKYIRMALKDDPEDFKRHARLMSVLRLTNRFDEAQKVYDGIIVHPNLRFELDDKQTLDEELARVKVAEEQYMRDQEEAAKEATAATETAEVTDGIAGADESAAEVAPAAEETSDEMAADASAAGE
jgi:tetratricopeptide (TPR) repeat protein